MEINAQPSNLIGLNKSVLNSLSVNNRRLKEGSDEVLINPAYDDISDDSIADALHAMLDQVLITPELMKIEESNQSKFGPRSLAKQWDERKQSLYDYFHHQRSAIHEMRCSGSLRLQSISNVTKSMIKSSSAGLPYMQKKGAILENAIAEYNEQVFKYPCVLFTRTQEGGKTRNVWGYPVSDTIHEQTSFQSFLPLEKRFAYRAALLGPDEVDSAITNLLSSKSEDQLVVSLDFSSYDASVKPEHSTAALARIASYFQPGLEEYFEELSERFYTIPIYTPEGEVSGAHGVPSGSSYTNTVDSLVQFAASGETYRCQIQGDDGAYIVPKSSYDDFISRFKSYGLTVNEEKSYTFDTFECVYLQRYYSPEYRNNYSGKGGLGGVYSIFRAMNRIKYLERWTNFEAMKISGSDFFSLRTIMILENCKHHPCFTMLVKYAQSLDKDKLSFTRQGLKSFSKGMESKVRAGVMNQFGDSVTGIDNFETVKILNS